MAKRLQVILESVARRVREALRQARRLQPPRDADRKLQAIRIAAQFEFPTADIGQMLVEIERGYAAR